ncbi:hypothetical protein ABZ675_31900, partial [Streptomyces albidoflavus]
AAVTLTGARYGALGIIGDGRSLSEPRFFVRGDEIPRHDPYPPSIRPALPLPFPVPFSSSTDLQRPNGPLHATPPLPSFPVSSHFSGASGVP